MAFVELDWRKAKEHAPAELPYVNYAELTHLFSQLVEAHDKFKQAEKELNQLKQRCRNLMRQRHWTYVLVTDKGLVNFSYSDREVIPVDKARAKLSIEEFGELVDIVPIEAMKVSHFR